MAKIQQSVANMSQYRPVSTYRLFLPEKFFCFSISKTVLQWLQWLLKCYYSHIPTLLDDIFVTKRCYNGVTAVTIYNKWPISTLLTNPYARIRKSFLKKMCLEKKPIGAIQRYA